MYGMITYTRLPCNAGVSYNREPKIHWLVIIFSMQTVLWKSLKFLRLTKKSSSYRARAFFWIRWSSFPLIWLKTKPIGDSSSASFDVGLGLLGFVGFVQPTETGDQAHGNGRPYPMSLVHLFQVAFSTMSSTALVPMICYAHPNGQRSRLVGISTWGEYQKMLTVIKNSWSHLQRLSKTYFAVCTDVWKTCVWTCFDRCRTHANWRIRASPAHRLEVFEPPKVESGGRPASQLGRPRGARNFMEYHDDLAIEYDEGEEGVDLGDQCEPCGPCQSS